MIIDSSSLIIFAKINMLGLLTKLYNKISITDEIYKETVEEGLKIDSPDAKIIETAINNKQIEILHLNEQSKNILKEIKRTFSQLGRGESESIALALQTSQKSLIIDEKIGRKVCKLYNIKPIGTLRIILDAYKKSLLKENEVKDIVNEIVRNKFRIGADVMNEFWEIFEKARRKSKD